MKIAWPIISEGLHPIVWLNNDNTPPPLGGVEGALEFYAATTDTDSYNSSLGTETGSGIAQVGTGASWTPDFEGVAWEGSSQQPSYKGARYVRNECTYSDSVHVSATWTKYDTGDGIVPIITKDYTTDDNGKNVDRCQFRAGAGNYSMLHYRYIGNDSEKGIAQIRCKSNTGANQRVHFKTQGNSQNCITVTPEWKIFYVNEQISTATFGARFEAANGSDIDILVDYFQIEVSEGRTDDTTPSEYVEKISGQTQAYFATLNGNTTTVDAVNGNTVVYGEGEPIEDKPYLVARGFSNEALTTPINRNIDWFSSNHSNVFGPYTMEFDLTGVDISNLVDIDAVPILSLASDVLTLTDGVHTVTKACTAGERKIGILYEQGAAGTKWNLTGSEHAKFNTIISTEEGDTIEIVFSTTTNNLLKQILDSPSDTNRCYVYTSGTAGKIVWDATWVSNVKLNGANIGNNAVTFNEDGSKNTLLITLKAGTQLEVIGCNHSLTNKITGSFHSITYTAVTPANSQSYVFDSGSTTTEPSEESALNYVTYYNTAVGDWGPAIGTMQLSVDGELSDVADWLNTWGDGRFGVGADVREVQRWDRETLSEQRSLL